MCIEIDQSDNCKIRPASVRCERTACSNNYDLHVQMEFVNNEKEELFNSAYMP